MSIEDNDNNFTIKDTSSEFAKYLPNKWIEPLTIIARVKGYRGIDEYLLNLIRERVEMFTDTRDNLDDDFQEYMHNTIKGKDIPNEWAFNKKEEESDNKGASQFVKQVHEGYNDLNHTDDKEKEDLR